MRFGINTFLFSCPFTDASTRLFPKFKKWGFESVEISVEDPAHLDPGHLKAQLDQAWPRLRLGHALPRAGQGSARHAAAAARRNGVR